MTPDSARAALASQLAEHGEDVVLKRRIGTGATFDQVTVRAFIRGFRPDELVGGITQQDSRIIMGQEEILAAGWPMTAGGFAWPRNGDFILIGGQQRAITAGTAIRLGGEIVRLEATAKG